MNPVQLAAKELTMWDDVNQVNLNKELQEQILPYIAHKQWWKP